MFVLRGAYDGVKGVANEENSDIIILW